MLDLGIWHLLDIDLVRSLVYYRSHKTSFLSSYYAPRKVYVAGFALSSIYIISSTISTRRKIYFLLRRSCARTSSLFSQEVSLELRRFWTMLTSLHPQANKVPSAVEEALTRSALHV